MGGTDRSRPFVVPETRLAGPEFFGYALGHGIDGAE
jgi:hypothetical protein